MYRSNQYIAARISPVQLIVARSCHTYGLVLRVSLVSKTPRDDVHYQGAWEGGEIPRYEDDMAPNVQEHLQI